MSTPLPAALPTTPDAPETTFADLGLSDQILSAVQRHTGFKAGNAMGQFQHIPCGNIRRIGYDQIKLT